MSDEHIIRRTNKLDHIRNTLQSDQIIYISAFYGCGKTVLLDQLAEEMSDEMTVLRFDAGKDRFGDFERRASALSNALLLIDSLHLADSDTMQRLAGFLSTLPESMSAVLCGRAKMPEHLERMCLGGRIRMIGKDFVLFGAEEIADLFRTYDIILRHKDIIYLEKEIWGWAVMLRAAAEKLSENPQLPVSAMQNTLSDQFGHLLIKEVFEKLPENIQILLYRLSPFERFDDELARTVTEMPDAPELLSRLAEKSYIIMSEDTGVHYFIPFVQRTVFRDAGRRFSPERIQANYLRAAGYYKSRNLIPQAAEMYIKANDLESVKELLIENSSKRPSNGFYADLINAFSVLPESTLLQHPELIKSKCIAEALKCYPAESDRWYGLLKEYMLRSPKGSPERKESEEALAYLDIVLPQRGTSKILRTLLEIAKRSRLTRSESWAGGFNIAGNSVSLMNGGKDFCRWVPKGAEIYKRFRVPVERAVGRGGNGLADIAIAECELESRLDGDYGDALNNVLKGLSRVSDDIEMKCAAIGIQCRILAAQGYAEDAGDLIVSTIEKLPQNAPKRLRQNLTAYMLTLQLMTGDTAEALNWLENGSPDEIKDFVILDRYLYMLKMRLYIITGQWQKTRFLAAKLRNYFDSYDRPYMRIQLHILEAQIYRRTHSDRWKSEMSEAVKLAKKYKLARVIADEGMPALNMLREMRLPQESWEQSVIALTRLQAANYPEYMEVNAERPEFSDKEQHVYALMIKGYRNAKIGQILGVTERTVKHYVSEIYRKLGVESRAEAIAKATELGDIR